MQQLECPKCHATLEYGDKKPSFCAYCGQSLGSYPPAAPQPSGPASPETATFDPEAVTVLPPAGQTPVVEADPESISGYRLLRVLGSGGMGKVFEAEDVASGRKVALKLISADVATSSDAVQRFRQEGRLASMVSHPRCVFVLAADEEAGRPYIVMELMPGTTLQDLIKEKGALAQNEAVLKILDVIEGLEEAHQLGVVHRDVKPSNCFIDHEGRVKIGDFGLSKSLVSGAHLTRTGAFMGTPLYSSPEQIRGEKVDQQTDVYAVAATLYCLLTGKAPFQTTDAAATLARIVADDPPSMRTLRPGLPAALDQVVLQGLERDRKKRWHNLEEFRRALLPFAPGQLSAAGLGVRFAAYLSDFVLLWLLMFGSGLVYAWLATGNPRSVADPAFSVRPFYQMIGLVLYSIYFFLCEGVWTASVGKRLLGLRVCTARTNEPPGLVRGAIRIAVFYPLVHLGDVVTKALVFLYFNPKDFSDLTSQVYSDLSLMLKLGVSFWLLQIFGIVLNWCTMRRRNGYRGLHEFASGTRVIALPQPDRQRSISPHRLDDDLSRPAELPERVGHFTVRGALHWHGAGSLLLGEDRALQRTVLLWLRPASEPPLPAARRELSRSARLRWLAGGRNDTQQWDAVQAPVGCPLAEYVAAGPLPWKKARSLLEQLTDELEAAVVDGTLPRALTIDQVWVHAKGRLLLLDAPLGHQAAAQGPGEGGMSDEAALDLLRQTATLALEGKPRPPGMVGPIRTPLPGHARGPLDRLTGATKPYTHLQQWEMELQASREQPAEITRPRRIGHLAIQAAFLCLPMFCMLPVGALSLCFELASRQNLGTLERGIELVNVDTRCGAVAALNPHPLVRVVAVRQVGEDLGLVSQLERTRKQMEHESEGRLSIMSRTGREYVGAQAKTNVAMIRLAEEGKGPYGQLLSQGYNPRHLAKSMARQHERPLDLWSLVLVLAVYLAIWPSIWVVWAFLTRGGLSLRMAGIQLLRADGRPAALWQCALRALLVWLPLWLLLTLSIALESTYWRQWNVGTPEGWIPAASWVVWLLAMLLVPVYLGLAVWLPTRSLHDRLVGTYLVPR